MALLGCEEQKYSPVREQFVQWVFNMWWEGLNALDTISSLLQSKSCQGSWSFKILLHLQGRVHCGIAFQSIWGAVLLSRTERITVRATFCTTR